jgi:hypothetical protein
MSGTIETEAFLAGPLPRMIRAAGRRVADADEVELGMLIAMRDEVDAAIQHAVDGQRARGVSWARIGEATGITRQSAQERWGS